MKRVFLPLAIVAIWAVGAQAGIITVTSANGLFYMDPHHTSLNLLNWENHNDTVTANGVIDVGETLRGIVEVSNSYSAGQDSRYPSGFELTGIFEVEVIAKNNNHGPDYTAFQFGPSSSFTSVYGAGAMIALFEDHTPDFNPAAASTALAEGTATDSDTGLPYLTIGAPAGGTWGTDYYWASVGPEAVLNNVTVQSVYSSVLSVLTNNSGIEAFLPKETEAAPGGWDLHKSAAWPNQTALAQIVNQVSVSGKLSVDTTNQYPAYVLESVDPAQVYATPEPTSLLLWSVLGGTLGLCATWRRRRHRIG